MALVFDGASYLTTGDLSPSVLPLQGAAEFTIAIAIRATDTTGTQVPFSIGKALNGHTFIQLASGVYTLNTTLGTGTIPAHSITPTNTGPGAEWDILLWRYDGATLKTYARGQELSSDAGTFTLGTSGVDAPVRIGDRVSGSSPVNTFTGEIGFVAGWNVAIPAEWALGVSIGHFPTNYPGGLQFCYGLWGTGLYPDLGELGNDIVTVVGTSTSDDYPPSRIPDIRPRGVAPCWLLDFEHPTYPMKIGSYDVGAAYDDELMIGAAYQQGIVASPNDPSGGFQVRRSVPRVGGAVTFDESRVAISSRLVHSLANDWEGRAVEARIYCPRTRTLQWSYRGVIERARFGPEVTVFELSAGDAIMTALVPALTLERSSDGVNGIVSTADATERPVDTGPRAPIPVACGSGGLCRGRYVGKVDAGERFIFAYGGTAEFIHAYAEKNTDKAGEEPLILWDDAPGDITRISSSSFDIGTKDLNTQYNYKPGLTVRYTADSPPTDASVWTAASVVDYEFTTSGVVTLSTGILPSPLSGTLQIAADLQRENDQWEDKVGGVHIDDIVTGTWLGEPGSRPVAVMDEGDLRANPSDFFYEILTNDRWGLSQNASTAYRDQAAANYDAAGLGDAIAYVLGGDGERLTLARIIEFLALLRGQIVWRGPGGQWRWKTNENTGWAAEKFYYGTLKNNVVGEPAIWNKGYSEGVGAIRFWYEPGGEATRQTLEAEEYASYAQMTVGSYGRTVEYFCPFVRTNDAGGRAAYFTGKGLTAENQTAIFRAGLEGIGIPLLKRCFVASTGMRLEDLDGVVVSVTEDLSGAQIEVVGPWTPSRYTYNAADVALPFGGRNPGERSKAPGAGVNLVPNATFAASAYDSNLAPLGGTGLVPGWTFVGVNSALDDVRVVVDPAALGGRYLEVDRVDAATIQVIAPGNWIRTGMPVSGANRLPMIVSAFLDVDGGSTSLQQDILTELLWYIGATLQPTGTPIALRRAPGEVNGKGWPRWWGVAQPPSTSITGAALRLNLLTQGATYRIDWAQVEWLSSLSIRPTPPTLNPESGVQPRQIAAGPQYLTAAASLAGLEVVSEFTSPTTATTLSGASTVVATLGEDAIIYGYGLTVSTAVVMSAGTTFDLRIGSVSGPYLARNIPQAVNTKVAGPIPAGPQTYASGTQILAVPSTAGATFSSGAVRDVVVRQDSFSAAV